MYGIYANKTGVYKYGKCGSINMAYIHGIRHGNGKKTHGFRWSDFALNQSIYWRMHQSHSVQPTEKPYTSHSTRSKRKISRASTTLMEHDGTGGQIRGHHPLVKYHFATFAMEHVLKTWPVLLIL